MAKVAEKRKSFKELTASKKLEKLSNNPPDMTEEGFLSEERLKSHVIQGCDLKLLFGTERVNEEILAALFELAQETSAVECMKEMQAGEVINKIEGFPSEERKVLHTAMRAVFQDIPSSPAAKEAAEMEKAELKKLEGFLKEHGSRFNDLVMIGIGGSNLGPEAAYVALSHLKPQDKNVHFIANIDPDETAKVLDAIDMEKTLVMVVSKSGSTLETLTNYNFLKEKFESAGLNSKDHFIAMTGEGSPLDDKSQFLECFYSWDFIGGRYCTSAMYGAILLSFAFGFDTFMQFLKGAHEMDLMALNEDPKENMPLMLALLSVWNHNFLKAPTLAMIPYSQALRRLPAHIQQVEMESNGKHIDRYGNKVDFQTGMIIWGEPGTNGQHSFFQLIHQGTQVVPLELIGFKECQYGIDLEIDGTTNQEKLLANLVAQAISLAVGKSDDNPNKEFEGNRPSHLIVGEKLTPYILGALFSLLENKVAFEGFIWNINSFDQEGVQLGKKLAIKVLTEMEGRRSTGSYPGHFEAADALLEEIDFS